MTQAELAQKLGRPQSFVTAIETAGRRVDVVELLNLAVALEFDCAELINELVATKP